MDCRFCQSIFCLWWLRISSGVLVGVLLLSAFTWCACCKYTLLLIRFQAVEGSRRVRRGGARREELERWWHNRTAEEWIRLLLLESCIRVHAHPGILATFHSSHSLSGAKKDWVSGFVERERERERDFACRVSISLAVPSDSIFDLGASTRNKNTRGCH